MAELGVYYGIRHKSTGELMPQAKRNRGYSNWNPAVKDNNFEASLGVPRLLHSRRQAQACINQWAVIPNGHMTHGGYSYTGEELEPDIAVKEDGRTKDDLEIVELLIKERCDEKLGT